MVVKREKLPHACESMFGGSRLFGATGFVASTVLSYRFFQPQLVEDSNLPARLYSAHPSYPLTSLRKKAAVLFLRPLFTLVPLAPGNAILIHTGPSPSSAHIYRNLSAVRRERDAYRSGDMVSCLLLPFFLSDRLFVPQQVARRTSNLRTCFKSQKGG